MLVTMALVAVVSLAAFIAIGVMSQHSLRVRIDAALEQAISDGGAHGLPRLGGGWEGPSDPDELFDDVDEDDLDDDAAAQPPAAQQGSGLVSSVPVYCVTVTGDGVLLVDDEQGASMDASTLAAAVDEVLASGNSQGSLADYDLFFHAERGAFGTRIAFADKSDYDYQLGRMALMLAVLWVLLMLAMLAVTLFLARLVTRPVDEAWMQQQRFIADASHELKTPLAVILADTSILAASPDATVAEQREWVDSIADEAGRMQRLTEDMLMLAQADAGAGVALAMGEVDLSKRVERACLQYEAVAFEQGIAFTDDIAQGMRMVGDVDRIDSMLATLLENAFKYCGVSGSVEVRLAAERGQARLAVRNSGTIAAEDLPHVFERFYRSDSSRAREGATASFGLGLSIAKSTAELHGGTIEAASADGVTAFTVTLPLASRF